MLVNALHLFNELGEPVITLEYLEDEIDRLREENEDLKRRVRSLAGRLRSLAEDSDSN